MSEARILLDSEPLARDALRGLEQYVARSGLVAINGWNQLCVALIPPRAPLPERDS